MPVTRQEFRDAMARLGAAVNVVTTDGQAGKAGMTCSAVCSVTDDPPTLLVCLNRSARGLGAFLANGVLCVNVLAAGHHALSDIFAGKGGLDPVQRFGVGRWTTLDTGAPVLEDGAVVSFDCRVTEVVEKGTHSVLFAEVAGILQGGGDRGLIYFGRDYHPVGSAA